MDKRLSLMDFEELRRNNLDIIRKCQEWGMLPHEGTYMCPKCGKPLKLGRVSRKIDGYLWTCNFMRIVNRKKVKCNTSVSLRTKSFFEKSHLTIVQILAFVSMWVQSFEMKFIIFELNIASQTATDWLSFCREVACKSIVENAEKLGGDGKTVEIIESKFKRRKYNGDWLVPESWVFGGYERGSGKVFMEAVPDRTQEILLKIIKKWIRPGSKIISDCWRAYDSLSDEGYQRQKMNHILHFVDPETGAHTNNIKLAWNVAKISISPHNRKGISVPGNLARYLLTKKAKALGQDPVLYFYELAGKLYNPLRERDVDSEEEVEGQENTDEDDDQESDRTI